MNRIAATLAALSACCMGLGAVTANEFGIAHSPTRWTAVDGDTIASMDWTGRRERYRLNGIDAAEKPGHCRRGRVCAPGDPFMATRMLEVGMDRGPITVERIKRDRYGRWIAQVRAGDTDLSCWQLEQGQAIYKRQWDEGGRTARCKGNDNEPR